jgi:ABC-type amino acid transport substrate-binding protein
MSRDLFERRRVLRTSIAAASATVLPAIFIPHLVRAQGVDPVLEKIRARGSISFGVYNDMAPFHDKGRGIDVDIATALAESVGLKASLLPFEAGENMNDDLRNMVWRGHYLGWGPADVLVHVPVDKPLMDKTPQALIFAPYYRETLVVVRDKAKVPNPIQETRQFAGHKIAVPGQSMAGWLMIGSDQGAYREQLITKLKDSQEAVALLKSGQVSIAAGMASEIESTVLGDDRFAIDVFPGVTGTRGAWPVGLAVKREAKDLARLLQGAMNQLAESNKLAAIFKAANVQWRRP